MGRPRDEFSWAQVEVIEDGWICKFCKDDFKGSASRIRNHLSGQGTDISACPAVPEEIRKEALKKVTRKRGRTLQSSSSSTPASLLHDPLPSSSNESKEERVTDAFLKFLICNKLSSVDSEVLKDTYLREFLERVNKYGVPSSLLLQGGPLIIKKSLMNIEHEVYQHMLTIKESWKTTGCTMMMFNLNRENRGNSFVSEKEDRYVCGFYCPKGFIFVETPDPRIDSKDFLDALKRHSPSLEFDDVNLAIVHPESIEDTDLGNDHLCEFNYDGNEPLDGNFCRACIRQEMQRICIKACRASDWAQGLINKAIHIQLLIPDNWKISWLDGLLKKKRKRNLKADEASGVSTFLSIMLLEDRLKEKLSYEIRYGYGLMTFIRADVEPILDDSKFWGDGRKLQRALNLILKIPDLMDTLVPTAGYLTMAVDEVKDTILKRLLIGETVEDDALEFWQKLDSHIRESTLLEEREATGYLNPIYFLQQIQSDPDLQIKMVDTLRYSYEGPVELTKLEDEIERYHNVFSNLPGGVQLKRYHPVKLWEKYGNELPLLQKRAIKLLSQPVTCMCNQVKKHLYQLQGADDFLLRLNVRMMEDFKLLGDDIYKPLDLSELKRWFV